MGEDWDAKTIYPPPPTQLADCPKHFAGGNMAVAEKRVPKSPYW